MTSDLTFDQNAQKAIPAEVRMISGCRDSQSSADVSNVDQFKLPDPAGRAGGACTSALLQVMYAEKQPTNSQMSFVDVLFAMRGELKKQGYSQIPQLSSSRIMNIHDRFHIVKAGSVGVKRAVLVGINYVGQDGELSGCHNDVGNMKEYIKKVWGFEERNITVLMDDGHHILPTRSNIMSEYKKLVERSQEGDTAFCHYSGHGGQLPDDNGDEEDKMDETIIPVDFKTAGQIRDDDLFKNLVCPMKAGVTLTCLMDCCHSGTVLDLPYCFIADGESEEMQRVYGVNFESMFELYSLFMAAKMEANQTKDVWECCDCILGFLKSTLKVDGKEEEQTNLVQ